MTSILLDIEIMKAIGLSTAFIGVILSIIAVGISILIHNLSKRKEKPYLKMAGLISAWAVFIILNLNSSLALNYKAFLSVYSLSHLISIFIGAVTIIVFLFMLSNFWKKNIFDKKLLIISGFGACAGLTLRIINPFLKIVYLSLLQRILIILPPLLGFFMIIKSYIKKDDK